MTGVTLNNYGNVCNSCTIFIALIVTAFLIIIGISNALIFIFIGTNVININPGTEAVIY